MLSILTDFTFFGVLNATGILIVDSVCSVPRIIEVTVLRNIMMNFLLYARKNETGLRLRERIQSLTPDHDMESFGRIDNLFQRLRQPVNGFALAIILAGSRSEFEKILEAGDLLEGLRTIIIVPDRNSETISAALKLHPRYMSYADGDFLDVSMVAGRMLQKSRSVPV